MRSMKESVLLEGIGLEGVLDVGTALLKETIVAATITREKRILNSRARQGFLERMVRSGM